MVMINTETRSVPNHVTRLCRHHQYYKMNINFQMKQSQMLGSIDQTLTSSSLTLILRLI